MGNDDDHSFTGFLKTSFMGTIFMGEPPQKMHALFDTGSSNMVVCSSECHRSCKDIVCNPLRQYFNPELSKTYKSTGMPVSIHYGTGPVRGVLSSDVVYLSPNLAVKAQVWHNDLTTVSFPTKSNFIF